MGAAFATMVKSFVDDLLMPIVGKLVGNVDFANLYVNLSGGTYESAGAAAIYYGAFINTVISFLILGALMFLIARMALKMEKPAPKAPPTVKVCPHCTSQLDSA